MTRFERPLRRQLVIDGQRYTVTMDAFGIKLARRSHRHGLELSWKELSRNGDGDDAASDTAHDAG